MTPVEPSVLGRRPIVTTVSGQGSVVGEYDRIRFNLTITGTADTGAEAKAKLKEPLRKVDELLKKASDDGIELAKSQTVSPYSIRKEHRWSDTENRQEFSHYVANYQLGFVLLSVEAVTALMDSLTEINGLEVASPQFLVSTEQRTKLEAKAQELAVEDARSKFQQQCKLLGKNPESFEVSEWSFENARRGNTGYQASCGAGMESFKNSASRIVVSAGEATITAGATLSFAETPAGLVDGFVKPLLAAVNKMDEELDD